MKRICFILACFLVVFVGMGFSNDAPVRSVGKTIQPLKDVQVRMVSEDVSIALYHNRVNVVCTFELLNEGPPDTIDVGFPRGWEEDLCGFNVYIGDKQLEVKDITSEPFYGGWNGENLPWWKVFRVPFVKTGETVIVRNIYWTPFVMYGHIGFEDYTFTYITKTGAFWKGGKIDRADFKLSLLNYNPRQLTKISPEGYEYEYERSIKWNFKDFVPDKNIELSIMQDMVFDRKVIVEKMLANNPDDAYAHFLLATVYFSMRYQGDKINVTIGDKAIEEFNRAIALDPENLDARWFLAYCYFSKNAHFRKKEDKIYTKQIIEQLEEIIKRKPDYICKDKMFMSYLYSSIPMGESPSKWIEFLKNEK